MSVSKNLLLETLAGGFETGALTIAHDLPLKGALMSEIGFLRARDYGRRNLVLQGGGKGHHADMAVALALAFFASENLIGGYVGEYRLTGLVLTVTPPSPTYSWWPEFIG